MSDKTNFAIADLVRLNSIEDPRLSPDGRWVAFVRLQIDREKNTYQRNIWLAAADGSRLFPLTRTGKDTQPRWSPDGRFVAFTSARADKPQIYVAAFDQTGDPRRLTDHPNGASAPAWSPDGAHIAFTAGMSAADRVYEDDPADARKPTEDDEKKRVDPRVITSMPYRTGTTYITDKFAQIYVIPFAPDDNGEPARPRRLTHEDASHGEPAWSPDGRYIYTSRAETPGADEPGRSARGYRIRVEDGVIEQFTDHTHAAERALPSASGRYLAFMRYPADNMALRYARLALLDTETDLIRDVNVAPDLAPLTFAWGGNMLYFSAQSHGSVWIYRVDPETGEVAPAVSGEFRAERFDAAAGVIAYAAFNGETLSELYVQKPGEHPVAVTGFNAGLVSRTAFGRFERVTWESEPGVSLEGWVVTPPDFDPSRKYPLVLDIHGGPHIMWSPHYEGEWVNWQALTAAGYIVFFANPRGSVGYGDAFQQAIAGQWGTLAYKDIIAGFEQVVARDYIDPERIGIMGGSYGGYMTAWTIAHDHRFKAAVAERGVYNLVSFTGTTDIPSFIPNEFGFELPANPSFLWEQSPIAHAHKIRTPLLIIHSENDFRVAISEAEQLFALTRRNGLPVEFVRYPREGHELSRAGEPEHRIDRLNRIVAWFDKYLKPA